MSWVLFAVMVVFLGVLLTIAGVQICRDCRSRHGLAGDAAGPSIVLLGLILCSPLLLLAAVVVALMILMSFVEDVLVGNELDS